MLLGIIRGFVLIVLEILLKFAWRHKGWALANLGRFNDALECYDKSLSLDPDYAKCWNCKGMLLDAMGKFVDAVNCFCRARELSKEDCKNWYNEISSSKHSRGPLIAYFFGQGSDNPLLPLLLSKEEPGKEVVEWFTTIKLSGPQRQDYVKLFIEHGFDDLSVICTLSSADIDKYFPSIPAGHRMKIVMAIESLNKKDI